MCVQDGLRFLLLWCCTNDYWTLWSLGISLPKSTRGLQTCWDLFSWLPAIEYSRLHGSSLDNFGWVPWYLFICIFFSQLSNSSQNLKSGSVKIWKREVLWTHLFSIWVQNFMVCLLRVNCRIYCLNRNFSKMKSEAAKQRKMISTQFITLFT